MMTALYFDVLHTVHNTAPPPALLKQILLLLQLNAAKNKLNAADQNIYKKFQN